MRPCDVISLACARDINASALSQSGYILWGLVPGHVAVVGDGEYYSNANAYEYGIRYSLLLFFDKSNSYT